MTDKIIKQNLISGDDLTSHYGEIKKVFADIYKDSRIFPNPNKMFEEKDARIMFYSSVITSVQNTELLSYLVKDNLYPLLDKNNYPKDKYISVSSGIIEDLKGNLMFNIFLRFENFIKLIAKSQGINGDKINKLSKDLRKHLNLDPDYDNLISIFTYIRNTIHTEGFHTRKAVSVTYNGKTYDFEKDKPISFIDDVFLLYLFTEVNKLVVDIIETDKIKNIPNIPHNISGFTYEYEQ